MLFLILRLKMLQWAPADSHGVAKGDAARSWENEDWPVKGRERVLAPRRAKWGPHMPVTQYSLETSVEDCEHLDSRVLPPTWFITACRVEPGHLRVVVSSNWGDSDATPRLRSPA